MAYCKTKYELSVQDGEPSWIKLQVDAHQSGCTLCHLIDEATQNGGILPLAIADELRLPVIEKPGNAWVGADSQSVIIYDGQQLLVG
jgi:hypothetical protein